MRASRWTPPPTALLTVTALWLATGLLMGCGEERDDDAINPLVLARLGSLQDPGPSDRFELEGLEVFPFDLNGDNIADMWKIYANTVENAEDEETTPKLLRKEVDSNFDTRVDVWFVYNERELLKEQLSDVDHDGAADLVEYYEDGRIVIRELYRDGLENYAMRKHYRDGRLFKIEINSDPETNDTFDRIEIYLNGELTQVGHNRNGDDEVDYWDDFTDR